jgi:antitoxin Phd
MLINLDNIVSISDANRNFSQVARKVDTDGPVVIMKNNRPRYVITTYNDTQYGGTSMRKLHFKKLTITHPKAYYEMDIIMNGEGVQLITSQLSDKRAARQTQLFQAYVALYTAKRLGLDKARALLRDQGETVAMEDLGLPSSENQHALLATWFSQALMATGNRERLMALYNAYGALPGGYADIENVIRNHLGPQEAKTFLDAIAAERYDEGDLADKAPIRETADYNNIHFDAHLKAISAIVE